MFVQQWGSHRLIGRCLAVVLGTAIVLTASGAPTDKAPAAPYYSVQVSTEKTLADAQATLKKVAGQPDARAERRGTTLAVRIGAWASQAEAIAARERLKPLGYSDAVVLKVTSQVAWILADGPAPESDAATTTTPVPAQEDSAATPGKSEAVAAKADASATDAPINVDAPAGPAPTFSDTIAQAPPAGPRDVTLTFRDLGAYTPLQLYGVDGVRTLSFGVRRDEAVIKAKLKLRFTYSPALIRELSHIKVLINGETLDSLLLPKETVTTEIEREIDIDPRYFTDFNHLSLQLIGHYTWQCEDAAHSSLWVAMNNQSTLQLTLQPLTLRQDLAYLPAPFFDSRDSRRLELPFVFSTKPELETVRAAGTLASWFGAQAAYRSARFDVLNDRLPKKHAVVFLTNGKRINGLELPDVKAPTISLVTNPAEPTTQLLVLRGRNAEDMNTAALALVLGEPVLSGRSATVASVTYAPRRPAYDAPNWARTDRPVKFGELVDTLSQLEAYGHVPDAIRVNLRVPPDLFTWNNPGVRVDLGYRYTPPVEVDNSMMTISINDKYIESLRLAPERDDATNRLLVPIFGTDTAQATEQLTLPAFQVGADNQLQFRFALDYFKRGACRDTDIAKPHSAIDPESSIDLSKFYHYVAMPNLALFANAGWPFSKFADLAETVVVVPDQPSAKEVEAMLFLLGRIGRQTGTSALRYGLMRSSDVIEKKPDADLLVIGGPAGADVLSQWGKDLPLIIEKDLRSFAPVNPTKALPQEFLRKERDSAAVWNVALQSKGQLAAIMGFESPIAKKRSVVAFASPEPAGLESAIDALEDGGRVQLIQADLALIHENTVESFRARDTYYVGYIPIYLWIWHALSDHFWVLAILAVVAGLLVAFWLFGLLKRATARRRSA